MFRPVDLARDVGSGLDLLQQTLPRDVGRPQPVALIDGLPGAEPLGKIPPMHPTSHPVQDPIDHLSMIPPSATTAIAHRQERPQPFPLGICQIAAPHAHNNDRGTGRSR